MRLRMYAATVTGTLAVMLTGAGLYLFTEMNIGKIFFTTIIAYMVGIGAVLWITEPKEEPEKIIGGDFKIFDLKAGTEFVEKR